MSSVLATPIGSGCCGVCTEAVSRISCTPQLSEQHKTVSPSKSRLYISRSRLPHGLRKIERETELDQLLLDRGWTVMYPEQLPVNEQLRHLRQAQVIAGPLGSAFHLLFAFGSLPAGPLLLTLGSPGELTTDGPGLNFGLQFRRQQMVEHLHWWRQARRSQRSAPASPLALVPVGCPTIPGIAVTMLKLLLGDPNARKLKRYQPIVSDIQLLEEDMLPQRR